MEVGGRIESAPLKLPGLLDFLEGDPVGRSEGGAEGEGEAGEAADVDPACLRLRVERQTLRRLPRTGAIVFTIRVYLTPIEELAKEPGVPGRMASAIRSWPDDVARCAFCVRARLCAPAANLALAARRQVQGAVRLRGYPGLPGRATRRAARERRDDGARGGLM